MAKRLSAPRQVMDTGLLRQESSNGWWLKIIGAIASSSLLAAGGAFLRMDKTLSEIKNQVGYLAIAIDKNQTRFESYTQGALQQERETDHRINEIEKSLARKGML